MASDNNSAKIQNEETFQTNKLFEYLNLNPKLLEGVYNMGFHSPSKFQKTVLPILLAKPPQDLIVQCPVGIDRTSVIVLTMLSKINVDHEYPQVIYISPRHELADKIAKMATLMAKHYSKIKINLLDVTSVRLFHGKLTEHIIIGTAEKLYEWGLEYCTIDFKKVSVFILDEVEGYEKQALMNYCLIICKNLSPICQVALFSTTCNEDVMDFASYITDEPTVIKTATEMLQNTIHYYIISADLQEKYCAIKNICTLLKTNNVAIIFCDSRKEASALSKLVSNAGLEVALLTGDINGEQRTHTMVEFKNGRKKILISTYELLIKDIHLRQVVIIINFNLPVNASGKLDYNLYLCRTNHTGILGNKGVIINIIDSESSRISCETISKHFDTKVRLLDMKNTKEIEKFSRMISR